MAKTGRPKKDFSWERLESLCQRKMSLLDCAEIMQCSDRTIEKKIRAKYNQTFFEFREQKMAKTRIRLIEKILTMADAGNLSALIFSLKNMCGWSDVSKVQHENPDGSLRPSIYLNIPSNGKEKQNS